MQKNFAFKPTASYKPKISAWGFYQFWGPLHPSTLIFLFLGPWAKPPVALQHSIYYYEPLFEYLRPKKRNLLSHIMRNVNVGIKHDALNLNCSIQLLIYSVLLTSMWKSVEAHKSFVLLTIQGIVLFYKDHKFYRVNLSVFKHSFICCLISQLLFFFITIPGNNVLILGEK